MKAVSTFLAGGVALAALAGAAPAAAQYYPNPQPNPYGYGYGQGGGLGTVIDQILGGNRYAYGVDQRVLVNQCIAAVTNQIERRYGAARYGSRYGGYGGGYGAYGGGYGGARVLGITNIDPDRRELQVRGIATANAMAGGYGGAYGNPYGGAYGNPYGGGYGGYGNARPAAELSFRCDIDYAGRVRDIDINRNRNYGYRR